MSGTPVYLSGPMSGIPEYNFPAFHAAAKLLRERGFVVFNPAESFAGQTDLDYQTYLRADLQALAVGFVHGGGVELHVPEFIVLLPGWDTAAGSLLEVAAAVSMDLPALLLDDGELVAMPIDAHAGRALDGPRDRLSYVLSILGQQRNGPEPLQTWEQAEDGLLEEANRIVNSDRQRTYGHPITHHTATAAMWSAYLTRANGERQVVVRPQDVSMCMILDKVSRSGAGDKVDNALDIAGYAQVHAKVRARQVRA